MCKFYFVENENPPWPPGLELDKNVKSDPQMDTNGRGENSKGLVTSGLN